MGGCKIEFGNFVFFFKFWKVVLGVGWEREDCFGAIVLGTIGLGTIGLGWVLGKDGGRRWEEGGERVSGC